MTIQFLFKSKRFLYLLHYDIYRDIIDIKPAELEDWRWITYIK